MDAIDTPLHPSQDELIQAARADFLTFVDLAFPVLKPGEQLIWADYIDLLGTILMRCAAGISRRVIINLPPRFMKSDLCSILYPAWRLGNDPTVKLICASYGDDLAHSHSAAVRRLMVSSFYRAVFPGTILDKKAVDHLVTTKGGYRYATAVGSDIAGFGADEIILDDPIQPDDAESELVKAKLRNWVHSSLLTRFNDPKRGIFVLVMHRLAPDDLSATLEAGGGYAVVRLPLIAEELEYFHTTKGHVLFRREPGEVLHPRRFGPAEVEALRRELPPSVFGAQYQQRPTTHGSGLCSLDRLRRYDKAPKFELLIHSWDVGATVNGNPSVCTKWGLARNAEGRDTLFLTELIKLKCELPDVRAAIKGQNQADRPALIVMDANGVGLGIYQDLLREGMRHLVSAGRSAHTPNSKVERFTRALNPIYDGLVVFPSTGAFLEGFFSELAAFPNGPTDDQVDSMTQVIAYIDNVIQRARIIHKK